MKNVSPKEIDEFYEAVLKLKNTDECKKFFGDICTVKEIISMSQRLGVARMLMQGNTFTAIEESTGASSATISRVNRCLQYGEGGYEIVLKK